MYDLLFLAIGLLFGGIAAWFIAKYKFANKEGLSREEINQQYVHKQVHDSLVEQKTKLEDQSFKQASTILDLNRELSAQDQTIQNFREKLVTQKRDMEALQIRFTTEFENIANRLLEEKSTKFSQLNQDQLGHILNPLKDQIKDFEQKIERSYLSESKERFSLKKEIEQLRDLNMQLSNDANNLVNALKGDNKTQGDWGEFRLEMILEKAGLESGIHFRTQASFKDINGNEKRPDFIINLPEGKHLVLDSKVSLKAYEAYYNANTETEKASHLKAHMDSLRQHIRDLNSKNYQHLYQINSPDYLLMFVPIEPAFSLALQNDSRIFMEALDRNIVLVTSSTLLATLRTVSYIWKQEKQKKSVLEIARQSGMLYDKFCNFVEDLKSIGQRLDQTQASYHDAMNKLVDSKKFGDTLIGRAERIRKLGANASKLLPDDMLE